MYIYSVGISQERERWRLQHMERERERERSVKRRDTKMYNVYNDGSYRTSDATTLFCAVVSYIMISRSVYIFVCVCVCVSADFLPSACSSRSLNLSRAYTRASLLNTYTYSNAISKTMMLPTSFSIATRFTYSIETTLLLLCL